MIFEVPYFTKFLDESHMFEFHKLYIWQNRQNRGVPNQRKRLDGAATSSSSTIFTT